MKRMGSMIKFSRIIALVLALAVLAGILVGCAGGMADKEAAPLNPDAALPVLVWSGDKPQLPGFTAWEYAAQPGLPVNIEELLARIWEGQEYETYDHGEPWTRTERRSITSMNSAGSTGLMPSRYTRKA